MLLLGCSGVLRSGLIIGCDGAWYRDSMEILRGLAKSIEHPSGPAERQVFSKRAPSGCYRVT